MLENTPHFSIITTTHSKRLQRTSNLDYLVIHNAVCNIQNIFQSFWYNATTLASEVANRWQFL